MSRRFTITGIGGLLESLNSEGASGDPHEYEATPVPHAPPIERDVTPVVLAIAASAVVDLTENSLVKAIPAPFRLVNGAVVEAAHCKHGSLWFLALGPNCCCNGSVGAGATRLAKHKGFVAGVALAPCRQHVYATCAIYATRQRQMEASAIHID